MLKRVAILLFCLMIVFIATFGFVVGIVAVPTIYSYADTNSNEIYIPLRDQSDLVKAFQAYCKSRDLTIDGSVADAVTKFTTGAFNGACNTLGINISQLQAELKAEYDQSGQPVKFLFNSTGVMAMNRIFAQFLQDNNLEVGDVADQANNTVYNGEMFSDNDGNTCFVTLYRSGTGDNIIQLGTPYKYTGQELSTLTRSNSYSYTDTLHINNSDYILASTFDYQYSKAFCFLNIQYSGRFSISNGASSYSEVINNSYGFLSVGKIGTSYYLGWYVPAGNGDINYNRFNERISISGNNPVNVFVFLNTNNTVINNNVYEGDTIINNEGDVINDPNEDPDDPDDPDPPGGTTPGWDIGGGDGTVDDGNGNTWNIKFPDFELPDLNIDWQIHGLGDKFPFSIPFDLVALVTVLNAEPEAPRFEGTVDFGFTTWDYDINLEQFDTVASACRIAEILLLVFGLILITRSIIKG